MKQQNLAEAQREQMAAALERDYRTAELNPRERAMLDYASKLTLTPKNVSAEDISRLRAEGLADRAIHDLCAITAYYAFVNRLADGLGVELEEPFNH